MATAKKKDPSGSGEGDIPSVILTSIPFKTTGKKGKKLKSRVSNFHITMNTNVRIDEELTQESKLVVDLQTTANQVFTVKEHFGKFVLFPKGGQWDTTHIVGLNVKTGVEVGKDDSHGRRLHLHVQFKVNHRSFIRLDFKEIQLEMNRVLRSIGYPHEIHYTHVTCHKPELEDYIGKD